MGDIGEDEIMSEPSPSSSSVASDEDIESDGAKAALNCSLQMHWVNKDVQIQNTLKEVRDKIDAGEKVAVRLKQEPENPFDKNAIHFECYNQSWQKNQVHRKEIVDDVNNAINTGCIVAVEFAWVWKKAPGYYAAINVTKRNGERSLKVKKSM